MKAQATIQLILCGVLASTAAICAAADPSVTAQQILTEASIQGGLIIHVDCGDGKLTTALRVNDSFLVQGLDTDAKRIEVARQNIQALGLYGKVSVDQFDGKRLPYIDNFANLIVVSGECSVTHDELLRVLAPNGIALFDNPHSAIRIPCLKKPRPANIDEWTHYLHGPDNNAVANDAIVGPPKHYQWIGSPDYLRHHEAMSGLSAMVSAQGRLFYIMDLGPRWSILMPPQWTLLARDAFNGTILWQRPIAEWHPHLWSLKHGPSQIMRRLVAVGDTVFVTLGYGKPVTALDAATGKTLQTFAGTENTEEIIVADGILYALVNPAGNVYQNIPKNSVEAIHAATRTWNWDEKPRRIAAIEAATGKMLWNKSSVVAPSTLAAADTHIYFHDGDKVVCLDAHDGKDVWTSQPVPRWKPMHVMFSPILIVHEDVVLFAGGEKFDSLRGGKDTMTAFSAKTGKTLWTAPHPPSGYASAEDLFVINDLAWCGVTSSPRDSGVFTGRDLHTGKAKIEFPPDDWKHMPHHRCYRAKATCNFILTSRTGIEFVDFNAKHWTDHDWVRGSCNYGVLPCNGLLYAGPHSCACFLLAKLTGMNALAPAGTKPEQEAANSERLERGTAAVERDTSGEEDWPTFRHDTSRSGVAKTSVSADLKRAWATSIGGRLSAMTVADGKLFVSSVETHTIHALDMNSGKPVWSFTTGGRVDSPPTLWQGRVLFGSADGHVYCLRARDGALVWKFRATPEDRRMMAHEQVESVWPVSGSVLVRDGIAYCVAGRAMWLDGGLRFLRLDAATGKLLSETVLDDKYPGTQDNLQKDVKWPNLPVALPDILSCDNHHVYMRSQPFDFDGKRLEVITPRDYKEQRGETAHLFSPTGFLDDAWWHRTYWMWGRSFISAAGGWQLATYQAPAGKILVCDDASVYGFGPAPLKFLGTPNANHLFACAKDPKVINPHPNQAPRKIGKSVFGDVFETRLGYDWSQATPLLVRGLVLAGDTLFAAGPPVMVNEEEEVYLNYDDPTVQAKVAEHVAAFEGRKGALLMAMTKKEGKQLATYQLDSPPVFDGMIAANGRLFVATIDGKILCLGNTGAPLTPAPNAKLAAVSGTKKSAHGKTSALAEPTTAHPDFQKIENLHIANCDLGYRLQPPRGEFGMALKKLDQPLNKHATFRLKARTTPGAPTPDTPGNAFFIFGNAPDKDQLIQCGYRISSKALSITQGSLAAKGHGASQKADLKANEITDLTVTVDLAKQKVQLTGHGQTVDYVLTRKLDNIGWIGCAVQSVTADFSTIEITGE